MVVAAPCCSQAAADLGAVIKFLSYKGIFDSLWHIKTNIIILNFTTEAESTIVDPAFFTSRYLSRDEEEWRWQQQEQPNYHSTRAEQISIPLRFCAEILFLGGCFYVLSHSVQMVSGPPGFRSAIKRHLETLRC